MYGTLKHHYTIFFLQENEQQSTLQRLYTLFCKNALIFEINRNNFASFFIKYWHFDNIQLLFFIRTMVLSEMTLEIPFLNKNYWWVWQIKVKTYSIWRAKQVTCYPLIIIIILKISHFSLSVCVCVVRQSITNTKWNCVKSIYSKCKLMNVPNDLPQIKTCYFAVNM